MFQILQQDGGQFTAAVLDDDCPNILVLESEHFFHLLQGLPGCKSLDVSTALLWPLSHCWSGEHYLLLWLEGHSPVSIHKLCFSSDVISDLISSHSSPDCGHCAGCPLLNPSHHLPPSCIMCCDTMTLLLLPMQHSLFCQGFGGAQSPSTILSLCKDHRSVSSGKYQKQGGTFKF